MALAISVFPTPGSPSSSTPLGGLARPLNWVPSGSFRYVTTYKTYSHQHRTHAMTTHTVTTSASHNQRQLLAATCSYHPVTWPSRSSSEGMSHLLNCAWLHLLQPADNGVQACNIFQGDIGSAFLVSLALRLGKLHGLDWIAGHHLARPAKQGKQLLF